MKAILSFVVEVPSIQKATAIRDKCGEWLNEDDDVTVTSQAMAQQTSTFVVNGVDVQKKEPFEEQVEAESPEAAAATFDKSKNKVVATVVPLIPGLGA